MLLSFLSYALCCSTWPGLGCPLPAAARGVSVRPGQLRHNAWGRRVLLWQAVSHRRDGQAREQVPGLDVADRGELSGGHCVSSFYGPPPQRPGGSFALCGLSTVS